MLKSFFFLNISCLFVSHRTDFFAFKKRQKTGELTSFKKSLFINEEHPLK